MYILEDHHGEIHVIQEGGWVNFLLLSGIEDELVWEDDERAEKFEDRFKSVTESKDEVTAKELVMEFLKKYADDGFRTSGCGSYSVYDSKGITNGRSY